MKLEFIKKARDNAEAVGAGDAIKKDNLTQSKLPEVGKLVARATSPLSDKFTLLPLIYNDDELT